MTQVDTMVYTYTPDTVRTEWPFENWVCAEVGPGRVPISGSYVFDGDARVDIQFAGVSTSGMDISGTPAQFDPGYAVHIFVPQENEGFTIALTVESDLHATGPT